MTTERHKMRNSSVGVGLVHFVPQKVGQWEHLEVPALGDQGAGLD